MSKTWIFNWKISLIQSRIMLTKIDELIQMLKKVYEEQTGEKAELLAIGGGTYARSLTSGVAFGPFFQAEKILPIKKMNICILRIC